MNEHLFLCWAQIEGVYDDVIRLVFKNLLTKSSRRQLRGKLRHDAADSAVSPSSPHSCFGLDCKWFLLFITKTHIDLLLSLSSLMVVNIFETFFSQWRIGVLAMWMHHWVSQVSVCVMCTSLTLPFLLTGCSTCKKWARILSWKWKFKWTRYNKTYQD